MRAERKPASARARRGGPSPFIVLVSGQDGWARAHGVFADSFGGVAVQSRHTHLAGGHFFNDQAYRGLREAAGWLTGDLEGWAVGRAGSAQVDGGPP